MYEIDIIWFNDLLNENYKKRKNTWRNIFLKSYKRFWCVFTCNMGNFLTKTGSVIRHSEKTKPASM